MQKLSPEKISKLQEKLPVWAVKPHPTKTNMSAIHPMAVIDRLNEVFGFGQWEFKTEYIQCNPWQQKTKNGLRDMYMSAVKGTLIVPEYGIHIEQFGGSSNDDMGDALKGGATDALTKCASYLGVGAAIYKGQGNTEPVKEFTLEEAFAHIGAATDEADLTKRFTQLSAILRKDEEIIAKCKEVKNSFK